MNSLSSMIGQQMKWQQPSILKMGFELHAGDLLVARLSFRSAWGTLASAESGDGCWTFKRVGFWQTRATIRPCNTEVEIASFKNNTWASGGSLELADGRKYLANTNFWQTRFAFRTTDGQDLIHYSQIRGLRLSGLVDIEPAAGSLAELPWMVMLGWYLIIMLQYDSAAVTAATTASI